MKKLTRLMALTMMLSMMFSTVAFAAEDETVARSAALDELNINMEEVASMVEDASIQGGNSVNTPAAPLSEFYVAAVFSENQPDGEIIQHTGSFYQTATRLDHGGSWLTVVTVEVGYAGTRSATFRSSSMKLDKTERFDIEGDRIVDGYLCYWTYKGDFTGGMFSAKSKSINSPWNTMQINQFYIQ